MTDTATLEAQVAALQLHVDQLTAQLAHLQGVVHSVCSAIGVTATQTPTIPSDPRRTETGMGAILAPDKSSFV